MAITKIQSESLNLSDTYDFTGTVTGAGESNVPYFSAKLSTDEFISSDSSTLIPFSNVVADTASGFNNTSGNYKYTIPTGQGGKWVIGWGFRINPIVASRFAIDLYVNGTGGYGNVENNASSGTYMSLANCRTYTLSASDYIQLYVYQNSSGDVKLRTDGTFIWGYKITST